MIDSKKDYSKFIIKYTLIGLIIGFIIVLIPVSLYGLDTGMQIVANYILPAWFIAWVTLISYSTYKLYKVKKLKRKKY